MGYSNRHSIKVEGSIPKTVYSCPEHGRKEGTFCNECGELLIPKKTYTFGEAVIPELIHNCESTIGLINDDGSSEECGSGYDIEDEIKEFSKTYPDLTFIYSCQWESGMVDEGEASTDIYYIKNGVSMKAEVEVVYTNPLTKELTAAQKAEKWDALEKEIADFYYDEEGNERPDDYRNGLLGMGEVVAKHLGYF
jgi:hypothetical protein